MLVIISKYPKGANLDASAYCKEYIRRMCPIHAIRPIKASNDHCDEVGCIQTVGTTNEAIMNPTTPVKSKVNNGLSVECSFLVIIMYIP